MRKKITALIVTIVIVIGELYFMTLEATAGDRQCLASGCKNVRASGNMYCNTHTCRHKGCSRQKMSGSSYCSSHTCAESGCYKEVNSANERCATHKKQHNESTGIGTTTCNYSGC